MKRAPIKGSQVIAIILCLSLALAGCGRKHGPENRHVDEAPPPVDEAPPVDPLANVISKMTLRQKVGQLLIVGFWGTEIDPAIERLIGESAVGGLILMGRNVQSPSQVVSLLDAARTISDTSGIPLFLAVDEEGGRVSRLPQTMLKAPSAGRVGDADSSELANEYGKLLGEQVKTLGYNMVFAPVLDVNTNPFNTVIADRAFGTEPESVAQMGTQAMLGVASTGVIPVVKHFPGHGDTSEDSHQALPYLEHDTNRLRSTELLPFKNALNSGADAVMVGHIVVKAVDDSVPASLSGRVVNGLLRTEMGFEGVIVTDDLSMGAISAFHSLEEAAVQAVCAGVDIVLMCHATEAEIHKVISLLENAVLSGLITEDSIDESLRRILGLKQKYGLPSIQPEGRSFEQVNEITRDFLFRLDHR